MLKEFNDKITKSLIILLIAVCLSTAAGVHAQTRGESGFSCARSTAAAGFGGKAAFAKKNSGAPDTAAPLLSL